MEGDWNNVETHHICLSNIRGIGIASICCNVIITCNCNWVISQRTGNFKGQEIEQSTGK